MHFIKWDLSAYRKDNDGKKISTFSTITTLIHISQYVITMTLEEQNYFEQKKKTSFGTRLLFLFFYIGLLSVKNFYWHRSFERK